MQGKERNIGRLLQMLFLARKRRQVEGGIYLWISFLLLHISRRYKARIVGSYETDLILLHARLKLLILFQLQIDLFREVKIQFRHSISRPHSLSFLLNLQSLTLREGVYKNIGDGYLTWFIKLVAICDTSGEFMWGSFIVHFFSLFLLVFHMKVLHEDSVLFF